MAFGQQPGERAPRGVRRAAPPWRARSSREDGATSTPGTPSPGGDDDPAGRAAPEDGRGPARTQLPVTGELAVLETAALPFGDGVPAAEPTE